MCEICSKLTHCYVLFILDFEQINASWVSEAYLGPYKASIMQGFFAVVESF